MSVKALKHKGVSASLVMQSFREGLCNETSSRSRCKTERKCSKTVLFNKAVFSLKGTIMDKLFECAKSFSELLDVKYNMIIGRKGISANINIVFDVINFHHLIGLHKLTDISIARDNRAKVFSDIMLGKISENNISKSNFFSQIQNRFEPLAVIEQILDNNNLIFRYNERLNTFSLIQADFLLSTTYNNNDIYIFISKKENSELYFCRSFFPKEQKDYTIGQPIYKLLYKEKINVKTGETIIQYDILSKKETNTEALLSKNTIQKLGKSLDLINNNEAEL